MAVSPATDDGVVKLSVYSGGQAIPATAQLMSLAISRAVNTIPAAQLVLQDGDMATGEWEISDAALFNPGADIRIALGYGDTEKTVFEGVVIRHGLKITGENNARLVVECDVAFVSGHRSSAEAAQKRLKAPIMAGNPYALDVVAKCVDFRGKPDHPIERVGEVFHRPSGLFDERRVDVHHQR